MTFTNLFLLIMIPIAFLILFIYIIYIIFSYQNNYFLNHKGILIFQLDLNNRKVKKINFKNQKNIFKFINKKNSWFQLKNIINQIKMKEKYYKLYLNTINELEKTPKYKIIKLKGLFFGNNLKYLFKLKFYPEFNSSDFILSIEWKAIKEYIKNYEKNIKTINFKKIINIKKKYIGFLSFNLNLTFENSSKKIKKIFNFFIEKNLYIFEQEEIISLVYFSNNKNKLIKTLDKIKTQLEKKLKILGLNYLYKGSSRNVFKDVDSKKKYFTILKLIRYYLIVSIHKKIDFISENNFKYEKSSYIEYINNLNKFKNDLKTKNLISKNISIKNYETNEKTIDYIYPEIVTKINKKMLQIFLKNPNYKKFLIDSHIEFLDNKSKNLIIDINVNWLLKNFDKLTNKKIIYIINSKQLNGFKNIYPIIFKLQEKKFLFAFKISSYNNKIAIYIKKLRPKFIIIERLVWKNFDKNKEKILILLMTIKFIASSLNIKLIYEDPPKNINKTNCKKIGLIFSYHFS